MKYYEIYFLLVSLKTLVYERIALQRDLLVYISSEKAMAGMDSESVFKVYNMHFVQTQRNICQFAIVVPES